MCQWECQCHDLRGVGKKDQSPGRLSCSPSVVDLVTRGAQRDRKHFKLTPPHAPNMEQKHSSCFLAGERVTQHE